MDIFTVIPLLNEKRLLIVTIIIIFVLKKPRISKYGLKSKFVESTESAESLNTPNQFRKAHRFPLI